MLYDHPVPPRLLGLDFGSRRIGVAVSDELGLTAQPARTHSFAESLREAFSLPVHLWDERLTSAEAHRHLHAAGRPLSDHRQVVDQVAAVLILQSFLDAHRSGEPSYNQE